MALGLTNRGDRRPPRDAGVEPFREITERVIAEALGNIQAAPGGRADAGFNGREGRTTQQRPHQRGPQQGGGREEQPFTLAIAGYGTGKSHLGLTLATLLTDPDGDTAAPVLSALEAADKIVGTDIRALLNESKQPCLVVALNGMQSFDLSAEISRQITHDLNRRGLDTKLLDELRPRFAQAASLIRMSNEGVVNELLAACEVSNIQNILRGLEQQDENVYSKVHGFFAARGITIRALTGESVRDVIDLAVREYCSKGKPYRSLVVFFDEFGRYTEFATVRSQIAGSAHIVPGHRLG